MKKLIFVLLLTFPILVNSQVGDSFVHFLKVDGETIEPGSKNSSVFVEEGFVGISINDSIHYNILITEVGDEFKTFSFYKATFQIIHKTEELRLEVFKDVAVSLSSSRSSHLLTVEPGGKPKLEFLIIDRK
tara:strand:- start:1409 stop:1801 length:393 start_codon:yes stop_codon:yes gene_type:complete